METLRGRSSTFEIVPWAASALPGEVPRTQGDVFQLEALGFSGQGRLDHETPPSQAGSWSGAADQVAFRDQVLKAHVERSRKASGAPKPDLPADKLKAVPGTSIMTLPDTAAAAGRLLAAANADLARARQAGDADALRTIRLTVTSGYRGSQLQKRLWLGYFSGKNGYYDRTRVARAKLAGGPHSAQAVDYMLKREGEGGFGLGGRIAAPGYSNHQGGIAVDLYQQRHPVQDIANKSDKASRTRWRATWFHGWLKKNAGNFGFRPIGTEEWHWEYRPGSTGTVPKTGAARVRPAADHPAGKLWTFTARTLGTRVAVFCPKAALGQSQVQLLLFAHGLLSGCPRPREVPAGFISGPPFQLGRIIAASGRPMVLVVPLLDWASPGGERAFGPGRGRWHGLASPRNLNALLAEVLVELGRAQGGATPSLGSLAIAGHSRAYDFLEPLVQARAEPQMRMGALAKLSHLWAFDTTYAGDVDRWLDWLKINTSLSVAIFYRPGSGTASIGDKFFLRRGAKLAVTKVDEGHCEVPATRLPLLLKPRALRDRRLDPQPGRAAMPAREAELGELEEEVAFGPLTAVLNWMANPQTYEQVKSKGDRGGVYIAFLPATSTSAIKILKVGMASTFARRMKDPLYVNWSKTYPNLLFYIAEVRGNRGNRGIAGVVRMVEFALARLLQRAGLLGKQLPHASAITKRSVKITNVLPSALVKLLQPHVTTLFSSPADSSPPNPGTLTGSLLALPEKHRWEFDWVAPA